MIRNPEAIQIILMEIISCMWNYEKNWKGKMVVRKGLIFKIRYLSVIKNIFNFTSFILHASFFDLGVLAQLVQSACFTDMKSQVRALYAPQNVSSVHSDIDFLVLDNY